MLGQTLNNRYTVSALIGQGAMGKVYRATDTQTGQDVAVKVIARDLSFDPEMLERFRREGEAVRQLRHPNIVSFVDMFQHESQQVMVMEYVPGGSLHALIKQGLLPIARVRQITLDLCDALIRAHRLDIIHRDIKPENILMAEDGTPRLTDFGLARLISEGTRLTGTGTMMGTPYYMCPEAWQGTPLDAQADIWSLGVVVYEMLAGEVPFGGDTIISVMNKVLNAPLPDLKKLRPDIPTDLASLVRRMLTRDKQKRYASLRQVAADLERVAAVKEGARETAPQKETERKMAPRRAGGRWWVWVLGCVGGLLLLLACGLLVIFVNSSLQTAVATQAAQLAQLSATQTAFAVVATAVPEATKAPEATSAPEATKAPEATAAPVEPIVLKVWSFNNEIRTMAIAYQGVNNNVKIEYTMIPWASGEYQTKVKASLKTADVPDVIALEASLVKQYVESDFLADLGDLLPAAQAARLYPFVIDVGTDQGVTKAYAYQMCPGALFYRRSLAREYFGTDDPAQIQALLSDIDKYTAAAKVIKSQSGGNTYMVASYGDFQIPFFANRAQPWIVNDTLVLDPMVKKYVATAKAFRNNGYEARAEPWSAAWFTGFNDSLKDAAGRPKKIFSYFLPTWGLPYVLMPNARSTDGASDTSGDWGMIAGPLPYQWGGTWFGVTKDSKNLAAAKEFIRFATMDETNLTNWATGVYTNEYLKAIDPAVPADQKQDPGDFVSSQVVVDKIARFFDNSDSSRFLDGQNSYGAFAEAAPLVNVTLMQGSDDAIQRALADPVSQYLDGRTTENQMWNAWKANVRNEFPALTIR